MNWAEMFPEATASRTADQLAQPKTFAPADAGIWKNFVPGSGSYLMKGLAEVGRSISMVGAVPSVAMDALTGSTNRQDAYFKNHDEVFQNAVDYWTPKPGTVGKAGEIVGGLGGGLAQFLINPALAVANAQLNTSIDLVREGVDPGAALVAGDISGVGMALGVKAPFFGSTFARKAASGAGANVVQGAAVAGATSGVLSAAGNPEQARQFDPFDLTSRSLDVLLGVAFGGVAHAQQRKAMRVFTEEQKAALLVVNQARHLEQSAPPDATGLELTRHVTQVQQAVEQLLRGERVNVQPEFADTVPGVREVPRITADPEITAEIQRLAAEQTPSERAVDGTANQDVTTLPPQLDKPNAVQGDELRPSGSSADPHAIAAQRAIQQAPDMKIETGTTMPDGTPERITAGEFIARAEADLTKAQTDANLFRTAAECLTGML